MAFRRHFSRVGSAERCTETIFTDHQRQVCDYALVYAEKKNDGEAPYSVSFTATQSGDVIVQLHPHSQLERAVRHERQAQATEPPASASPAAPPAPAAAPPAAEPAPKTYAAAAASQPQGATAGGQPAAPAGPAAAARNWMNICPADLGRRGPQTSPRRGGGARVRPGRRSDGAEAVGTIGTERPLVSVDTRSKASRNTGRGVGGRGRTDAAEAVGAVQAKRPFVAVRARDKATHGAVCRAARKRHVGERKRRSCESPGAKVQRGRR